jgi:hypothetical protein
MTTPNEIEDALAISIDVMRMAEQVLRLRGAASMADYVRDRADKNIQVLLPWVRR